MRRMAPSAYLWLGLASVYFLVPLYATFEFSLKENKAGAPCCTLHNYGWVIHNGDFWHTIKISAILAIETIVISLCLFVPTIYWVHLKLPRLRPVIAFLALIPFVVPPIVMVVGLLRTFRGTPHWFYGEPWGFLAAAYVILAFPYMYFSLDAGFRSIDVHTLTEASQSLGAKWTTTLFKVILPEHPDSGSRGVLPDACDRHGRVHDREPRRVPHLPDLPAVRERVAGLPRRGADAALVHDHLGRDALAAPGRP